MKDRKATFVIKVLYRENATWQGVVRWVEESKEKHFRSEMELLQLMGSGVDAQRLWGEYSCPELADEIE